MSLQYEAAKVETFIDMYITGQYTLTYMCMQSGFSLTTYYHWKRTNEDFQKKLAIAEKMRIPEIKEIATRGLIRLCEGGDYEEVHEEYETPEIVIPLKNPYLDDDDPVNVKHREEMLKNFKPPTPVLIRRKVSRKVIMPNAASVQFALRNLDKENFPDLQKQELSGAQGGPVAVLLVKPGSIDTHFPSDLEEPADDSE